MKKSFIAVLLCMALVLSFAACGSDSTEVVTDENGETQTVEAGFFKRLVGADAVEETTEETTSEQTTKIETVTDKNGEAVTGSDGKNVTTVVTEEQKIELTPEEKSEFKKLGIDVDNFEEKDTEVVTMALEDGLVTETTSVKPSVKISGGVPVDSPSKTFKEIIDTGTYTMEATISSGDVTVPVKLYMDGSKYAISTKMKTGTLTSVRAEFINDGKNVYLVLPSLGCYINAGTSEELLGDTDAAYAITDPEIMQGKGATYVQSATVEIDGTTYDVEEYTTDTDTLKYYYLNDDLKRIEDISSTDGTSTIIDITNVTGSVPSGAFTISSAYKDVTSLFESGGYDEIASTTTTTAKSNG